MAVLLPFLITQNGRGQAVVQSKVLLGSAVVLFGEESEGKQAKTVQHSKEVNGNMYIWEFKANATLQMCYHSLLFTSYNLEPCSSFLLCGVKKKELTS